MPENESKKNFIAYYDERDGKGYIKGSKESTFKNMVRKKSLIFLMID